MQLRRYCVTVMDNWTPTREFWTWGGALLWWARHLPVSHLFVWARERPGADGKPRWVEVDVRCTRFGPRVSSAQVSK